MNALTLYSFLTLLFMIFFVLERCFPARQQSWQWRWFWRAYLINSLQWGAVIVAMVGLNQWLAGAPLVHLPDAWPSFVKGGVAYLVATFFQYWLHRALHDVPLLWRIHQLHHSPSRMEVLVSNYVHPLDFLSFVFANSLAAYWVLGLSDADANWVVLLTGAVSYWTHANLRSPHWVGYIVQRSAMHCVHHQANHHAQNYGLPLWDGLFGTWVNPPVMQEALGFKARQEEQIMPMMLGQDVTRS